jgi:hypothetical protein
MAQARKQWPGKPSPDRAAELEAFGERLTITIDLATGVIQIEPLVAR